MASIAGSQLLTNAIHSPLVKKKGHLTLEKFRRIIKNGSEAQIISLKTRNIRKHILCRLFSEHLFLNKARPLHAAVLSENIKLVRKLCIFMQKNSFSLNCTNHLKQTPLQLAVIVGNIEIVELLLNFEASPNLGDQNGNTILHLVVELNNLKLLQVLLSFAEVKIALNSMNHEGYSALHHAVMRDYTEVVRILHSRGADMNQKDGKSGRTPLIHAVLKKNKKMVDLLLECGSCPQEADFSGRSAVDYNRQTGNKFLGSHDAEQMRKKPRLTK